MSYSIDIIITIDIIIIISITLKYIKSFFRCIPCCDCYIIVNCQEDNNDDDDLPLFDHGNVPFIPTIL